MKAYGVYKGCVYEGGGVGSLMYIDKHKAIEHAWELVNKHNDGLLRVPEAYRTTMFSQETDTYWTNKSDCIMIQEFEII